MFLMTKKKSSNTAENSQKSAETQVKPLPKPRSKATSKTASTPEQPKEKKTKTPEKPIKSKDLKPTQVAGKAKKKKAPGKPFVKGDPRINRNGRPQEFDTWRKLNKEILAELAVDALGNPIKIKTIQIKNGEPVRDKKGKLAIEEHFATNAEMIVRAKIHDKRFMSDITLAAYGKPPDDININVDLSSLTNSQLARISRGESIVTVLGNPNKT